MPSDCTGAPGEVSGVDCNPGGQPIIDYEMVYPALDANNLPSVWAGEAFGGTFEETWNPASLGTMVGMFKVMGDGEISFYELMLLAEEEGSLSLKVKHFSADFAAWEDKEDYLNFRLVKVEDAAVHFSGLSFYRINDDEMHSYLTFRDGDSVREEKLVYRRVAP